MTEVSFRTPLGMSGPHVQSVLSSGPLRRALLRWRRPAFLDRAETVLLDCGDGVKLQGFYSPQPASTKHQTRGLVVLLHGWEGSAESTYMQESAKHLYAAGFDLFRLNFRDHGDTHHLNPELFHSCRLAEVVNAVKAIGERYADQPLMLAGYSLGGSFALRVANYATTAGIDLHHAMAICPPVSPRHSLQAIEAAPWIYETYFLRKWRHSLRTKQALFPKRYQLDHWLNLNLIDTTARLVEQFTEFDSVEDYFDGYSVAGDYLAGLQVPTTILAAADDPVIPVEQFHELQLPASTQLQISQYGGHCGFLESWRLHSWISRHLTTTLLSAVGSDQIPCASTVLEAS